MSVAPAKPRVVDCGLCRCCGASKKCRILTMEYEFLGQKEVYSDMMMDCFGLMLSHLDGTAAERLVCATCVVQLRAAAGFRRQVLRCEEAFLQMKMYDADAAVDVLADTDMKQSLSAEVSAVKEEPEDRCDTPLHSPEREPARPHSPPARAGGGREGGEAEEAVPRVTRQRASERARVARGRGRALGEGRAPRDHSKDPAAMSKLQQQNRERDVTYLTETNILNIIEYSYSLPFKCRHNNLLCYYCGQLCADPAQLRAHTESLHTPKRFKIVEHKKMVKVDLTRIDCRLCEERIADLEAFKKHIIKKHDKKYYFNYPDLILPFRLTTGEVSCTLCSNKYPYFHALNKHMNVHFSNYVCEQCGLGFVDKCRFLMHQQRHDSGEYPCPTCGKTFRALYNRELHQDRVHNKRGRVYCPKCDIKLMSYPQKLKHLVEVHGEAPLSFECGACPRVFLTRRMLTIHRRKDHLKDYRYECQFCGQKFFTRFSLNNHTPTHTGERNHRCAVCDKTYPRLKTLKDHMRIHTNDRRANYRPTVHRCAVCDKTYPRLKTLKDHMRIHTNDRRYRCHICGQAFIQNCSLKGHIKSQHPDKAQDVFMY